MWREAGYKWEAGEEAKGEVDQASPSFPSELGGEVNS